ncbi:MAG: hypothetical protein HY791_01705 [Deltaproteobacteria bacterium]|nr:hypothetical protein [Deltaproteobacteria bacterium]
MRLVFTLSLASLCACGDPPFQQIQTDVFTVSCSQKSCHGEAGAGGLVLDANAFDNLVNADANDEQAAAEGWKRVVPNDVSKSFLMLKLTPPVDAKYGVLMPKGRTDAEPLEAEKRELIQSWIESGAPKD